MQTEACGPHWRSTPAVHTGVSSMACPQWRVLNGVPQWRSATTLRNGGRRRRSGMGICPGAEENCFSDLPDRRPQHMLVDNKLASANLHERSFMNRYCSFRRLLPTLAMLTALVGLAINARAAGLL